MIVAYMLLSARGCVKPCTYLSPPSLLPWGKGPLFAIHRRARPAFSQLGVARPGGAPEARLLLLSPLPALPLKTGAAAKSLQSCPTLCDPIDGSPSGSTSLGFSRQEHWSRLPFPSPIHESEK